MSYAGSLTAGLLRAATLGRIGYKEGEAEGGIAAQKLAETKIKDAREQNLAAATIAAHNRTASLRDPNDPETLAAKERTRVTGTEEIHRADRSFDVAHPTRDPNSGTSRDKAFFRMRSAYKAKLMAPTKTRMGRPVPGMDEAAAEELTSSAWGPSDTPGKSSGPSTSTKSLLSGSILRGGGAATAPTKTARGPAKSTASYAQPGRTTDTPQMAAADRQFGATPGSAPTGTPSSTSTVAPKPSGARVPNPVERDMTPEDLWDKKVNEGMAPDQATSYVHRLKGTG